MYLAKVIGKVWATRKEDSLSGIKFLLVQRLDINGELSGPVSVAVDRLDAGEDEIVIIVEGSSARSFLPTPSLPVDAAVIGILDMEEMRKHHLFSKLEKADERKHSK